MLVLLYPLIQKTHLSGSQRLHVLTETVAVLLAGFIAIIATIRYYSKKNSTFLYISTGFIGVMTLDLYHALTTSYLFENFFMHIPTSIIPWSWNAGRYFLSLFMCLSWIAWLKKDSIPQIKLNQEKFVYILAITLTIISLIIWALIPLPRAYYPELFFGRPQEFGAAILFLIALIGYFQKKKWQTSRFEHWIMYFLILSFFSEAIYMPKSYALYDDMFAMSHILKIFSYGCVLVGLLFNMYYLFSKAAQNQDALISQNKALEAAKLEEKNAKQIAIEKQQETEKALKLAEETKNELLRMNESMVGRELKMVELKEKIEKLQSHTNE